MDDSITLVALTGHQNTTAGLALVRPLEPDDLAELTALHRHAYADGPAQTRRGDTTGFDAPLDEGLGETIERASLVISGPEGQITAAIIVAERNGEAVIAELFTHPDHRRQGLAEELLRHCIHALHTLGRPTVTVTVAEENAAALALYLSRDFRRRPAEDDTDSYADYD
ncbi:acetyltransferase [Arthrobacter sp. Hiyo6]|jgi:ribosomal protein S18 acetylase RimI-like enzyme|nr:acetyltransferase [Arthrobacter sp. Hiyo6]